MSEDSSITSPSLSEQEIKLWDYWTVLWQQKGLILGIALLGAAIGLAYALYLPKTYEAKVLMFWRDRPDLVKGFGPNVVIGSLPHDMRITLDELLPNLELANPEKMGAGEFAAIVSSQGMLNDVIREFHLAPEGNELAIAAVREKLALNIEIKASPKDQTISVAVCSEDPKEAAKIANFFPKRLNEIADRNLLERREKLKAYVKRQIASLTKENAGDSPSGSAKKEGQELLKTLSLVDQYLQVGFLSDIPLVEIMDYANPPVAAKSPSLRNYTGVSGFVSLILGVMLAFAHNYSASMRKKQAGAG